MGIRGKIMVSRFIGLVVGVVIALIQIGICYILFGEITDLIRVVCMIIFLDSFIVGYVVYEYFFIVYAHEGRESPAGFEEWIHDKN